jgi:hypothetical protein
MLISTNSNNTKLITDGINGHIYLFTLHHERSNSELPGTQRLMTVINSKDIKNDGSLIMVHYSGTRGDRLRPLSSRTYLRCYSKATTIQYIQSGTRDLFGNALLHNVHAVGRGHTCYLVVKRTYDEGNKKEVQWTLDL